MFSHFNNSTGRINLLLSYQMPNVCFCPSCCQLVAFYLVREYLFYEIIMRLGSWTYAKNQ